MKGSVRFCPNCKSLKDLAEFLGHRDDARTELGENAWCLTCCSRARYMTDRYETYYRPIMERGRVVKA
jgi:hypothetical protein